MPHRKFKLIFLSHDLTKKVELTLTRAKVRAALFGLAFCFLLTNVVAGLLTSHVLNSKENITLQEDNRKLRESLSMLENRFDDVNKRMAGITQTDALLRLTAGLPLLDKDVQEVGIGGGLGDPALDPDYPELTQNFWTLDKIEREINLQMASFEEIRLKLSSNAELVSHTPSLRPLEGGYVSSGFGPRRDPFTRRVVTHPGVDIPQERGTAVMATAEGQVIYAGRYHGYGNFVVIDHGFGYQTAYGHLNKIECQSGQYVSKGHRIGQVGSTGRSTSPHLHYEVRVNGQPVDPMDYFFDDVAAFPVASAEQ
jgi:murein DD-endopeptidase MepM/ murein hydrolase activator NlpD